MDSVSLFGFFAAASQIGLAVLLLSPLVLGLIGRLRERRQERRMSLPRGASIAS